MTIHICDSMVHGVMALGSHRRDGLGQRALRPCQGLTVEAAHSDGVALQSTLGALFP